MVTRGGTRGNGRQAGRYLTTLGENESLEILEVAGRRDADADYLHKVVESMSLMEELTKSKKGLYHAVLNPAYHEDKNMDWFKAADMLGEELGLQGQRRVIVKHIKKGRAHAHIIWERYDYETGKMKSDSFSRLAQDHARRKMEIEFGHKPTPYRNKHRPELKASLTQLWHQTGTGAQFVNACKNNGYMLAEGVGRHPYMVVDENGRSFDLVRQLSDVRLKEVRQRMQGETLIKEKAAIAYMRKQSSDRDTDGREKEKAQFNRTAKQITTNLPKSIAEKTAAIKDNFTPEKPSEMPTPENNKQGIAKEFADNKQDKTQSELQRLRQAFAKEREANTGNNRSRDMGLEYD